MLLIDTYNLLHHTMPPSLAGLDENRLCQLLARSRFTQDRILLVCDGQPKPHALVSPVETVEILYAGPGRSADDLIIQLADQHTAPRKVTVVTSDREIHKAVRRRRCHVVPCDRFIHYLTELAGLPPPGGRETHATLTERDTDAWLKAFGVDEDALDFDDDPYGFGI
ncbi:MAG: hypothetical protein GC164_12900 [Phycisphaera sp.]|nr:hypothetical protein [Phycisphaera sp.]